MCSEQHLRSALVEALSTDVHRSAPVCGEQHLSRRHWRFCHRRSLLGLETFAHRLLEDRREVHVTSQLVSIAPEQRLGEVQRDSCHMATIPLAGAGVGDLSLDSIPRECPTEAPAASKQGKRPQC